MVYRVIVDDSNKEVRHGDADIIPIPKINEHVTSAIMTDGWYYDYIRLLRFELPDYSFIARYKTDLEGRAENESKS